MTAAEHITRAKAEIAQGDHEAARTHALVAIAEALVQMAAPPKPVMRRDGVSR